MWLPYSSLLTGFYPLSDNSHWEDNASASIYPSSLVRPRVAEFLNVLFLFYLLVTKNPSFAIRAEKPTPQTRPPAIVMHVVILTSNFGVAVSQMSF